MRHNEVFYIEAMIFVVFFNTSVRQFDKCQLQLHLSIASVINKKWNIFCKIILFHLCITPLFLKIIHIKVSEPIEQKCTSSKYGNCFIYKKIQIEAIRNLIYIM